MDINKLRDSVTGLGNSIAEQVSAETPAEKNTPSPKPAGSSLIKDSFETVKSSTLSSIMAPTGSSVLQQAKLLTHSGTEITDFLRGHGTLKESMTSTGKFLGSGNVQGNVFGFMIEYQKMLNKEARGDKKLARADADLALQSKAAKIDHANQQIDQSKQEADNRYQNAMDAANKEMMTGIISGLGQFAAAGALTPAGVVSTFAGKIRDALFQNIPPDQAPHLQNRYSDLIDWIKHHK